MREIKSSGKTIIADDEDVLSDQDKWDHDVATAIAARPDVPHLDEAQIGVFGFLRRHYQTVIAFPIPDYVCESARPPHQYVNNTYADPLKEWEINGLPTLDGIHRGGFYDRHQRLEECCQEVHHSRAGTVRNSAAVVDTFCT